MTVGIILLTVVMVAALYWIGAYRVVFGVARLQTWALSQGAKLGGVWEQRALDFCASRILVWSAQLALPPQRIEGWWHQLMTSELQRHTEVFVEEFEGITPLPRSLDLQRLINVQLQHRALDVYELEREVCWLESGSDMTKISTIKAIGSLQARLILATARFRQLRDCVEYFGYATWPSVDDYVELAGLKPLTRFRTIPSQMTGD